MLAANASGLNDRVAATLLMTEAKARAEASSRSPASCPGIVAISAKAPSKS